MSSIAHHASHHGGGRDSLGSILEMGSSPAPSPGHHTIDDEDMLSNDDIRAHAADDEPAAELLRRDEEEQDMYLLALSYAKTHEHLRAAHVLQECTGPRARWLRGYTQYLAGEKRKQEQAGELLGPRDVARGAASANPFAEELLREVEAWDKEGIVAQDGFLLYLQVVNDEPKFGLCADVLPHFRTTARLSYSSPYRLYHQPYRQTLGQVWQDPLKMAKYAF